VLVFPDNFLVQPNKLYLPKFEDIVFLKNVGQKLLYKNHFAVK